MTDQRIQIFADVSELAAAVAQQIVTRAQAAVADHDRFTIALSGGSTPRAVFERLAASPLKEQLPWAKTYVFWGDDRAVPPDHPDSNYRMASESLLQHVPLPKEQIKPILTQCDDLDAAAQHYERVIQSFVPGSPPCFDLILLGMGPDGHTASLFPHSPALTVTNALVTATPVAPLKPHVRRITFTATLINAAAEVVFLVAGADKAGRLAEVLEGPQAPDTLPAQLVRPTNGVLSWMIDQAAAQELKHSYG